MRTLHSLTSSSSFFARASSYSMMLRVFFFAFVGVRLNGWGTVGVRRDGDDADRVRLSGSAKSSTEKPAHMSLMGESGGIATLSLASGGVALPASPGLAFVTCWWAPVVAGMTGFAATPPAANQQRIGPQEQGNCARNRAGLSYHQAIKPSRLTTGPAVISSVAVAATPVGAQPRPPGAPPTCTCIPVRTVSSSLCKLCNSLMLRSRRILATKAGTHASPLGMRRVVV